MLQGVQWAFPGSYPQWPYLSTDVAKYIALEHWSAMCWHSEALNAGRPVPVASAPALSEPAYVTLAGYPDINASPKYPPPQAPAPTFPAHQEGSAPMWDEAYSPKPQERQSEPEKSEPMLEAKSLEHPPGLQDWTACKLAEPSSLAPAGWVVGAPAELGAPPGLEVPPGLEKDSEIPFAVQYLAMCPTAEPQKELKSADSFSLAGAIPDSNGDIYVRAEWHIADFIVKLKKKVDNPLVSPALPLAVAEVSAMEVGAESSDVTNLPCVTLADMHGLQLMMERIPHPDLENMNKQAKHKHFQKMLAQGKISYGLALKLPAATPVIIKFCVTVGEGKQQVRSKLFTYNVAERTTHKCSGLEQHWQDLRDAGGGLTIGLEILSKPAASHSECLDVMP